MPTVTHNMSLEVEISIYGVLQVLRKFQSLDFQIAGGQLELDRLDPFVIGFGEVLFLERWAKEVEAVGFQCGGPPVW